MSGEILSQTIGRIDKEKSNTTQKYTELQLRMLGSDSLKKKSFRSEEENIVFVLCFHALEEKKPGLCLLIRLN